MPMSLISHIFFDIFNSCQYVRKTLPILALFASSLFQFSQIILHSSNWLLPYDVPFNSLISIPSISIDLFSLDYPISEHRPFPPQLVNSLLYYFIFSMFPDYCIVNGLNQHVLQFISQASNYYFLIVFLIFPFRFHPKVMRYF